MLDYEEKLEQGILRNYLMEEKMNWKYNRLKMKIEREDKPDIMLSYIHDP
jgi:hypothetical protein